MTRLRPRLLVTTPSAEPLSGWVESRGASAVFVPLMEIVATQAPPPPGRPAAVLVTSARTARFAPMLRELARGASVVAVGERTAASLQAAGVPVTARGDAGGAEAVGLLRALVEPHHAVWHVGAEATAPSLDRALRAWSRPVARWPVYRAQVPDEAGEALAAIAPVHGALFASGSTARAFARLWAHTPPKVAVIGPRTADEARAAGLTVHAVAETPSLEGLAAAGIAMVSR